MQPAIRALRKGFAAGVIAVALLLPIAIPTGAAEPAAAQQYITITPAVRELRVDPGGSVSGSMSVINQGAESFKLSLEVAPYRVEGVRYDPKFTRLPGTTDTSQWLALNVSPMAELAPQKTLEVAYDITVPAATQPGGYYAVVFAEAGPAKAEPGSVSARNRVGQVVYITVNGEVKQQGSARGGAVPGLVIGGEVKAPLFVRNDGGVHFKTKSTLTVKDIFGQTVYTTSRENFVLPQTEREIDFAWSTKALLGLYTIERSASVPGGEARVDTARVLVVHPLTIGILLVVLAAGFFYLQLRRARKGRSR